MTSNENEIQRNRYFYPGSKVLRNNFDIKDYDMLKEVEATNSFNRLLELQDKPLNEDFGKRHLNEINKYLFEDIYPFAGQYRVMDIPDKLVIESSKDIDRYLDEVFESIEKELMYVKDSHDFSELLSKLYNKLMDCYPYRAGNARTIREFLREYSMGKSREIGIDEVELDWSKVDDKITENSLTPVEGKNK